MFFCFAKNFEKLHFLVLNVNRFEILLRTQRGVTLLVWTICCVDSDKILILFDGKLGFLANGNNINISVIILSLLRLIEGLSFKNNCFDWLTT